jgi:hypothetical protein
VAGPSEEITLYGHQVAYIAPTCFGQPNVSTRYIMSASKLPLILATYFFFFKKKENKNIDLFLFYLVLIKYMFILPNWMVLDHCKYKFSNSFSAIKSNDFLLNHQLIYR